MPYADGPHAARSLWHTATIGQYVIGMDAQLGSVVIKAKSGTKKDKKGAAGKNKSKTTKQGKEDLKIEVDWEFTAQMWADGPNGAGVETILEAIDPNGPAGGGPFAFVHPDTDRRGCKSVTVKELAEVAWKGWHGSVKMTLDEWTEPTATGNAGAGGDATKTPDKSAVPVIPLKNPVAPAAAPNANP